MLSVALTVSKHSPDSSNLPMDHILSLIPIRTFVLMDEGSGILCWVEMDSVLPQFTDVK